MGNKLWETVIKHLPYMNEALGQVLVLQKQNRTKKKQKEIKR